MCASTSSDPRLRLTYALYNEGLARGLAALPENATREEVRLAPRGDETTEVRLETGTRTLPFGTLEIHVEPSGLSWGGYRLERFVSTTTLEVEA